VKLQLAMADNRTAASPSGVPSVVHVRSNVIVPSDREVENKNTYENEPTNY
jgi:hypothetical protein